METIKWECSYWNLLVPLVRDIFMLIIKPLLITIFLFKPEDAYIYMPPVHSGGLFCNVKCFVVLLRGPDKVPK